MVQLLQRVAALLVAAAALVQATNPLVPSSGAFIGVSIDWNQWKSVNDYSLYAQINPASYTVYVDLPLSAQDKGLLDNVVPQIAVKGALAIIVAQPTAGLAAMTDAVATSFAKVLNGYEQQGAIMMIQFGHEMNGNWYNWGQQPTAYVPAFQRITNAVRQYTCRTFMLWAPNNGGGYPFPNGTAIADYLTAPDFKAMDTNGDGQITQTDDPYAPFYPGDDYVDWVGCSIYHFGTSFPYGANVNPLPRTFTSTIFGTFVSPSVDYRGIPNFYEVYSGSNSTHGKPMCVPETSALYNENQAGQGASELSIKSTWWQQLYNVNGDTTNALDISVAMPNLKLISWFDQNKTEATVSNNLIDWTFTNNKAVHQGWLAATAATPKNGTASKYWLFLSDWITLTNKVSSGNTGGLITESVSDLTIQSTAAYSSVPNCLRQGTSSSGDGLAQYGAAAPSVHGTAGIAMLLSIAAVAAAHMLF